MKLKALVPMGHGINCERETRHALFLAGFHTVDVVHLNVLAQGVVDPAGYHVVVFPGGFLDGDDLGAAQACANRIRHSYIHSQRLSDRFIEFISGGGLVLGICNGFQLLAKLGMLPAIEGDYRAREVSLTGNDSGRFEDRWVWLAVDASSSCVFTKGIERLYLPVRHGEGKVVTSAPEILDKMVKQHQVVLRYVDPESYEPTMEYPYNPNGSPGAIAGLCDRTGRVFGLMPHPEAFVHRSHHPSWTREDLPEEGAGLALFQNAVQYLLQS